MGLPRTLDDGPCEKLERFALSYSSKSGRKDGSDVPEQLRITYLYGTLLRKDKWAR